MKTAKRLTCTILILGLLLAVASGCALRQEEQIMPSVTVPTTAPTQPSAEPTEPSTQPPATEPPATEPPPTEPPAVVPPKEPLTVCIDAGHQRYGISEKEPNGPGSDVMKAKLTSGTRGVSTKTPEYQLNLDISLLLEQELLARGYNVVMIRRDNDCPLSNAERALLANDSGSDILSASMPTVRKILPSAAHCAARPPETIPT